MKLTQAGRAPVVDYLNNSVGIRWKYSQSSLIYILQGDLCDFSVAAGGRSLNCHLVIICALGPDLRNMIEASSADMLILPDFKSSEICSLLNFVYTGQ